MNTRRHAISIYFSYFARVRLTSLINTFLSSIFYYSIYILSTKPQHALRLTKTPNSRTKTVIFLIRSAKRPAILRRVQLFRRSLLIVQILGYLILELSSIMNHGWRNLSVEISKTRAFPHIQCEIKNELKPESSLKSVSFAPLKVKAFPENSHAK